MRYEQHLDMFFTFRTAEETSFMHFTRAGSSLRRLRVERREHARNVRGVAGAKLQVVTDREQCEYWVYTIANVWLTKQVRVRKTGKPRAGWVDAT